MNLTEGNAEKISVTADEVIHKRQGDITHRVFEVDARMRELKAELHALEVERAQLLLEHDMWENYNDRNQVRMVHTTTTVEVTVGRKRQAQDRLPIEDCITQIFDATGRPMQFCEIQSALEKFGWRWNNYASAHNYIRRNGNIEPTGQHGYYNLVRNRGW